MSGKCDKSLKTAFLKITKFCDISENHPNKSKSEPKIPKPTPNFVSVGGGRYTIRWCDSLIFLVKKWT